MKSKIKSLLIILSLAIIIIGSSFYYVQADTQNQVILITINQLSYTDYSLFSGISGFKQIEKYGAKGAMNINSGGSRNDENSYLSIGVGSRAEGFKGMGNSYLTDEKITQNENVTAKEVYRQQHGNEISSQDAVIFLDINRLLNVQQKFPVKIGLLGETLIKHNLSARVYGNNDTNGIKRLAPLIIMNNQGISYGDVGRKTLLDDNSRPFGVKTNYDYLVSQLQKAKRDGTALMIFDLGDLYRLEQFSEQMDDDYEIKIKNEIFEEIGQFLALIISQLENNQTLIVVSPMVNEQASKNDSLLAPVWLYKKGLTGQYLTSGTTKREGIIANIDIAPTIVSLLGIEEKPEKILGQPITTVKSDMNFYQELEHISTIYRQRSSVLYPYVMWQVIILISSVITRFKSGFILTKLTKISLISLLFLPLILLLSAYQTFEYLIVYFVFFLSVSFLLSWALNFLKPVKVFFILGLITFLSITADIISGSQLMKRSFLGYDPVIGARYYGIGNEYMGIYIGATILFTAALLHFRKNILTVSLTGLIYALSVLILMFPTLGTNAGGAISAIFATGFTFAKINGFSWNKKTMILSVVFIVFAIVLIISANLLAEPDNQSHIGRSLEQLFSGNISTILLTVKRKISMNLKLIQVSSWSKVIITSIFVIIIFSLKNSFKSLKNRYLHLFYGFYGILVGAFISLLVNDSGVVSAATMIIYVAVPMLYLALNKQQEL